MGIRRVINSEIVSLYPSSTPCLILMTGVERSLFKRAYGASKFIGVLDKICMKLQSKLGGFMRTVKTKLFKELQSVRGVDDPTHT